MKATLLALALLAATGAPALAEGLPEPLPDEFRPLSLRTSGLTGRSFLLWQSDPLTRVERTTVR